MTSPFDIDEVDAETRAAQYAAELVVAKQKWKDWQRQALQMEDEIQMVKNEAWAEMNRMKAERRELQELRLAVKLLQAENERLRA